MKTTHIFAALLIGAGLLTAQNPNTAAFPGAVATDGDLFVAKNSGQTTLNGAISSGATSIVLTDATNFLAPVVIKIDTEIIHCSSKASNTLSGCSRGSESTSAASHLTLAVVYGYMTAWHHNQLAAEIKAIETKLFGATPLGTANMIVQRDGGGNFTANTITANLTGNAATASSLSPVPTLCTAGNYPLGILQNGNATGCTPASGSGNMADPGGSGVMVRTALNVSTYRTLIGTSPIVVTNGDGVSGNPTISFTGAAGQAAVYTSVGFSATPTFTATSNTVNSFTITLTGNVTSSTLASSASGQIYNFKICQDATGGRTFAWPTGFTAATAPSLVASVCTKQSFFWNGSSADLISSATADSGPAVVTEIAAPSGTPAAGTEYEWNDSTALTRQAKNSAAARSSMAFTLASASNQWLKSFNASTGVFTQTQPAESDLSFTDITTSDVSITKHGFAPKSPNDATKFLNGVGGYTVPAGSGSGTGNAASVVTATFSATPTFTCPSATAGTVTDFVLSTALTTNVTSSTLATCTTGQTLNFKVCQDGTGGRTFAWPTGFSAAAAPSLVASVCTKQSFFWDGAAAQPIAGATVDSGPAVSVEIAAPSSSPAAGTEYEWNDSTGLTRQAKNSAGNRSSMAFGLASASQQWLKSFSATTGLFTQTQPAFSDISGTNTVGQGGTGGVTFTNHGVLLGQAASGFAATGAGTTGQVLTSNGASADPTFQTTTAGSPTFPVNAQTATYQVLVGDFSACKTITVASGTFTITLVASGSQPANGQCIFVVNYGTGVVTIARSGQNINGGTTSLSLTAGSATAPTGAFVTSNGTDYFAQLFGMGTGGGSTVGCFTNATQTCAEDTFSSQSTGSSNYSGTGSAGWVAEAFPSSAWATTTGTVGHPGVVRGSTAAGAATTLNLGAGFDVSESFDGFWVFREYSSVPDVLNTDVTIGMMSGFTSNTPVSGFILQVINTGTAANWFFKACASSTCTSSLDTGVTASTSWIVVQMKRVDSTTVGVAINGGNLNCITTSGSAPAACTGTNVVSATTVPTLVSLNYGLRIIRTSGSATEMFDYDYARLKITGLTYTGLN